MFNISYNGIITINRGDSFRLPLMLNYGTKMEPLMYRMTPKSFVYFAVMEPNEPFENALIRKKYTIDDVDEDGNIVIKFRPDGFLYTQLDLILQANGIKSVVCCGCTTEGCVLATVMGAAFHNYYTCVAEDAVATSVEGAHEHAIWLMKKRYIVRMTDKIIAQWK